MVSRPWKLLGPFHIDKHSPLAWKSLFRDATRRYSGLADAVGVYIIGSSIGSTTRIRYVGMTFDQGFEREVFSQRNCGLVWDPLLDLRTGQVKLWLVAKPTPSGRGYSADWRLKYQAHLLETLFIMHAKAAGHKLLNTKKMKSADGISVSGLFGNRRRGKRAAGLIELANALAI